MTHEIVYGRQPVLEVLRAGRREVLRVLLAENVRAAAQTLVHIRNQAERRGIAIEKLPLHELDHLCRGGHHQGAAAEVSAYPYAEPADLLAAAVERREPPLLLMLDHVQDPQNLGAVLRSADAAGVHGVILPRDRAAAVTPAVVRASAGAAEHVSVAQVVNLHQCLLRLKEGGLRAAGLDAGPGSELLTRSVLGGPLCLVTGSEGEGLGRLIRETCDFLVRIPMRGRVASLNASAATAIALYECVRQRTAGEGA